MTVFSSCRVREPSEAHSASDSDILPMSTTFLTENPSLDGAKIL